MISDGAPYHSVLGAAGVGGDAVAPVRWRPAGGAARPRAPWRAQRGRYAYQGTAGVVAEVAARYRFTDAIERDDEEVLLLFARSFAAVERATADITSADDGWLELIREDDGLVEALTGRPRPSRPHPRGG